MHGEQRRRIEVDDAIRKQMQVRVIEEDEVETVVNKPQATTYPKRRGRPIEGRFLLGVTGRALALSNYGIGTYNI